jgi:fructose-1-phosphate kinase PfkB-like protein
VVSLGADGAVFVEDGRAWAAPGLPVAVASPVGAGDAMVAALAMAAEGGRPLVEAAALAMAAGAAAAATEGTGPPAPESVAELARRVELRPLV